MKKFYLKETNGFKKEVTEFTYRESARMHTGVSTSNPFKSLAMTGLVEEVGSYFSHRDEEDNYSSHSRSSFGSSDFGFGSSDSGFGSSDSGFSGGGGDFSGGGSSGDF